MPSTKVAVHGPLAAVFGSAAGAKLASAKFSIAARDHFGIAPNVWKTIGVLELAGVTGSLLGLKNRKLALAANGGLLLTGLGALATHLKAGDGPKDYAPAVLAIGLSGAALTIALTSSDDEAA